jgi:hypothetical protein
MPIRKDMFDGRSNLGARIRCVLPLPWNCHGARNDHEAKSAANLCLSLFFLAFV